jgi:hypothetical protein
LHREQQQEREYAAAVMLTYNELIRTSIHNHRCSMLMKEQTPPPAQQQHHDTAI